MVVATHPLDQEAPLDDLAPARVVAAQLLDHARQHEVAGVSTVSHPRVSHHLLRCEPLAGVHDQQLADQLLGSGGDGVPVPDVQQAPWNTRVTGAVLDDYDVTARPTRLQ